MYKFVIELEPEKMNWIFLLEDLCLLSQYKNVIILLLGNNISDRLLQNTLKCTFIM